MSAWGAICGDDSWFIGTILELVFGSTRTNSDGRVYSVRDIGEQHILEDFGGKFIPSAQDYLAEIEFQPWMQNGKGHPPSYAKIAQKKKTSLIERISADEKLKTITD